MKQSCRDKLIKKIAKQHNLKNLYPQSGTLDDFKRFIEEQKNNPQPSPVVTLEDFFEGNTNENSIGCNIDPHLGIKTFYSVLKSIREREDVQDVLVEINSIDNDTSWPFSEFIWIISRAPKNDVDNWVKSLKPDEITEGWGIAGKPPAAPDLKDKMIVYGLWWD